MPVNKKKVKPLLVVLCGLIGTGKSTLAAKLAETTGFEVLRSDELRKGLAGLDRKEHRYESFGEGIYSEGFFDATYKELLREASRLLDKGGGVILDASFKKEKYRSDARDMAERFKIPFLLIECRCPDEVIKQRLEKREREGLDISDGRWPVFLKQKNDFEDIKEISKKEHLIINTHKALSDNLKEILSVICK
ncbi:MAG: AAA family ATPase [bacterium]|nr:AAA family ATPase [bacterium]